MPGKNRLTKRKTQYNSFLLELQEDNKYGEEVKQFAANLAMLDFRLDEALKLEYFHPDKKKEMLRLYNILIEKAEKICENLENDKQEKTEEYKKLKNLRRVMSKDQRALYNSVKNNTDQSLNDIFETSRSTLIELDKSLDELPSVGGNQSKRFKLEMKLPGKKPVNGYFTESSKSVHYRNLYVPEYDKIALKYGLPAEYKKTFLRTAGDSLGKTFKNEVKNDSMYITYCLSKPSKELAAEMSERMQKNGDEEGAAFFKQHTDPNTIRAYLEYLRNMQKEIFAQNMNNRLGINENSQHDKRNSAMTAVAEMMGCENVVAHSENIHVKTVLNGKETVLKGTVMEEAIGIDPHTIKVDDPFLQADETALDQDGLAEKIANLQLVDYLCGNPDRHGGNVVIKYENGKVKDVLGIDNDTSFGAKKHIGATSVAVPLENLKVIPKATADKIMKMDEDSLKFMLYGYDLDSKEVKKTIERFHDLQDVIRRSEEQYKDAEPGTLIPGVPRVCTSEELNAFSIPYELGDFDTPGAENRSLFGIIAKKVKNCYGLSNAIINIHDYDFMKEAKQIISDYPYEIAKLIKKTQKNEDESKEFKDLLLAGKTLKEHMQKDFCLFDRSYAKNGTLMLNVNTKERDLFKDEVAKLKKAAEDYNNTHKDNPLTSKDLAFLNKFEKVLNNIEKRAELYNKENHAFPEKKKKAVQAFEQRRYEYLSGKREKGRLKVKNAADVYVAGLKDQLGFLEATLESLKNAKGVSKKSIERESLNIKKETMLKKLELDAGIGISRLLTDPDYMNNEEFLKGMASAVVRHKLEKEGKEAVENKDVNYEEAVNSVMKDEKFALWIKTLEPGNVAAGTIKLLMNGNVEDALGSLVKGYAANENELKLKSIRKKLKEDTLTAMKETIENPDYDKSDAFKKGIASILIDRKLTLLEQLGASKNDSPTMLEEWKGLKDVDMDVINYDKAIENTINTPAFKLMLGSVKAGTFTAKDMYKLRDGFSVDNLVKIRDSYVNAQKKTVPQKQEEKQNIKKAVMNKQ